MCETSQHWKLKLEWYCNDDGTDRPLTIIRQGWWDSAADRRKPLELLGLDMQAIVRMVVTSGNVVGGVSLEDLDEVGVAFCDGISEPDIGD